jgi:hypothetical protein
VADRIEREELRVESGLIMSRGQFNEREKELEARQAAGEPVRNEFRQLAADRETLEAAAREWNALPKGLPGHHSYRPAPTPSDPAASLTPPPRKVNSSLPPAPFKANSRHSR